MNTEVKAFLPQIMKDGFKFFDSLDDQLRLEQISKVHYIDTMARQLEKNLNSVNLFDIFPNNNNILTCSETEINKVLIDFNPSNQIKDRSLQILSTTQKENIVKAANYWGNDRRNALETKINEDNHSMQKYYTTISDTLVSRNILIEELDQILNNDGSALQQQIDKILETKKYKVARIDKDKIVFEMLDDIINIYKNERAGVNLRVNLGTFIININFNGMYTKLGQLNNNTIVDNYFHPHYDNEGEPCLGNLLEVMQEAQTNKDLFAILEINETLLKNYNEKNPYKALAKFAAASEQIQPNGKKLEIEEMDEEAEEISPQGANEYHVITCQSCENEFEIQFDSYGGYAGDCPECDYYDEFNYTDIF